MVAEHSPQRVLLTWADIADEALRLEPGMRDLLLELVEAHNPSTATSVTTAEGPWYVSAVHVRGHIGVGADAVDLPLSQAKGLTIVTARNGTGKTSVADGIRHVIGGGSKRSYQVLAENIHYPHRDIVVTVSNGSRDIEIVCGPNETVQWRSPEGILSEPPAEWTEAFARYMPVLLYPEMSQVIQDPSNLHAFLKDALELTALEELQNILKAESSKGKASRRTVETAHQAAVDGVLKAGHDELAAILQDCGPCPDTATRTRIITLSETLPAAAPPPLGLVDSWTVNEQIRAKAGAALERLAHAAESDAAMSSNLLTALQKALVQNDARLDELRSQDECPVCGTIGQDWVQHAIEEAGRLTRATKELRDARTAASTAIRHLHQCLPAPLTSSLRRRLESEGGEVAAVRVKQWDRLVHAAADLLTGIPSATTLSNLLDESAELATWYGQVRDGLLARRDDLIAAQATVRTHIGTWLDTSDAQGPALARLNVVERLDRRVSQWIKTAREEIFAPIAKEVTELWSVLNPDADLKLNGIALAGGTKIRRTVTLDLADGSMALPTGKDSSAVLSTGQRNALSLATYLPRATQPESPFGFLILDDPIHAFDTGRVRYLAKHLMTLAERFQVVVFTHDDRLWRELRAHGALPTHIRMDRHGDGQPQVRVRHVASPGIQRLDDIQKILGAERGASIGTPEAVTAMTLAICRQAVDTEAVAQIEILGRRIGLPEATVVADLKRARKTLDQLALLNNYAGRVGHRPINIDSFTPTVHALNGASHGRAPQGDPQLWVRQTRRLIKTVQEIRH
ncbi:hypothetical protein Ait01nite_091850 [Actinoplanes italicus]|uniref:AAA domain-containing protein n=1 Tax=Actinoplanes italicus TaxID=113567 RepID=A0A2T0JT24_9ACTN|nr:hypothetical protein [Actinoplanes italicus]PRX10583.1 hypothetical protein CLV67_13363 [Actinoplanes italicus]GIE36140.1 hypothetical protein Ait01nite_091850 [Actinoplanes italicus]